MDAFASAGDEPRPTADAALTALTTQELDPLSVAELEHRIDALAREIARARAKIDQMVNHRASAEAIFRR